MLSDVCILRCHKMFTNDWEMLQLKPTKARILVVEDDTALLRGLLDVLVFNGYKVKGAEDGGVGLRVGVDEQFDLILLDVMLPTLMDFQSAERSVSRNQPRELSSSPPKGRRMTLSPGLKPGRMTISPNPFPCGKSWCGWKRFCGEPVKISAMKKLHCRRNFF